MNYAKKIIINVPNERELKAILKVLDEAGESGKLDFTLNTQRSWVHETTLLLERIKS